jgi:hypothetical protein
MTNRLISFPIVQILSSKVLFQLRAVFTCGLWNTSGHQSLFIVIFLLGALTHISLSRFSSELFILLSLSQAKVIVKDVVLSIRRFQNTLLGFLHNRPGVPNIISLSVT